MMFHIDQFKCILCSNWFCPPFNLPYLLPCTHSICTNCLQKANNNSQLICPQDLQQCSIKQININQTTKKALQRLMKQHKNYNENTQLECIKTLSLGFDQLLSLHQQKIRNLQTLINQIFHHQIQYLQQLNQKINNTINHPFIIVQNWKQIVTNHLKNIRKYHENTNNQDYKSTNMIQINHYIEQGRKIKLQLNQFFNLDFDLLADHLIRNPKKCFDKNFTITSTLFDNNYNKIKNIIKDNYQQQQPNTDNKSNKKIFKNKSINNSLSFNQLLESTTTLHPYNHYNIYDKQTQPLTSLSLNTLNILDTHPSTTYQPSIQKKLHTNSTKPSTNTNKPTQSKIKSPPNFHKYLTHDSNHQPFPTSNRDHSSLSINKNYQTLTKYSQHDHFSQLQPNKLNTSKQQQQTPNTTKFKYPITDKLDKQYLSLSSSCSQPEQQNIHPFYYLFNNKNFNFNYQLIHNNNNKNIIKYQISAENSLLMSPQTIHQQNTEQSNTQPLFQQQQLLNDPQPNTHHPHINFLKQCKLKTLTPTPSSITPQIKQNTNNNNNNTQKQKLTYIQRMQIIKVQQLYKLTQLGQNFIQLINQSLHDIDMNLYLQQFDWKHSNIQIVKLVKTDLTDPQLNILLNYLLHSNTKTLVLNHNHLTDLCLNAFLNFVAINNTLKNVHLANNPINTLKNKIKISTLKEKGIIIW